MSALARVSENRKLAICGSDVQHEQDASVEFAEEMTFVTADKILTMLDCEFAHDWLIMPAWSMNLVCLQRPNDPVLLRQAAVALLLDGPEWDAHAEALERRAEQLENHDAPDERD